MVIMTEQERLQAAVEMLEEAVEERCRVIDGLCAKTEQLAAERDEARGLVRRLLAKEPTVGLATPVLVRAADLAAAVMASDGWGVEA